MKTYMKLVAMIIAMITVFLSCSTENTPVYLLKTSVEPAGSGTIIPAQGEFDQGDTVRVTATPNGHWVFIRWEGDYTGTASSVSLTMNGDMDISAVFEQKEYPLNIEVEGEGTVTEQIVQQKSTDYEAETTVELTAVASEGWQFSHWDGDLTGNTNPAEILIDDEKSVTAVFVRTDYTLTVNITGNGTVAEAIVQAKKTDYPYQTIVELTATPDDGWLFSGWEGDLTGNENPAQIEITETAEVTALFVKDFYTVSIEIDGPGMINIDLISGNQSGDTFEYDSEISIEIGVFSGWEFTGWEGDLSGTDNPVNVTVKGNISATAVMAQVPFEGNGTVSFPYQIGTLDQLQTIRETRFLDKHFVQIANIDASETSSWNNGQGFIPIGFQDTGKFTGTYDGDGFQINGLNISVNVTHNVTQFAAGLFGFIENASIRNLTLNNVDVTGTYGVGGLAGHVGTGSLLENVHVTGTVKGNDHVGGLAGYILNSDINIATSQVAVSGENHIGGLIGTSYAGRINASHSSENVIGIQNVGGLIGQLNYTRMISNSYATGNVSGSTNSGGLIGASFNTNQTIIGSFATGDVQGHINTGGLIGAFSGESTIGELYAYGNVSAENGDYTGGLIGRLYAGSVNKSYALGDVSGGLSVGGLAGRNDVNGKILESFAAGLVTGTQDTGGLAGFNQGVISNSYWDKEATGQNNPAVWDPYMSVTDAIGLTTSQMTGVNAQTNMIGLDWSQTWKTSDSYPKLKRQND